MTIENDRTLILLRGVSGAGKSTVSKLFNTSYVYEADSYFTDNKGNYHYDAKFIHYAHASCQQSVALAMGFGVGPIVVANTSTRERDLKPYIDLAEEMGYSVVSLIVENRHGNRNVHGVPEETLERQELHLRNNIKLRG